MDPEPNDILTALYCTPLTDRARSSIRQRLVAQRARLFNVVLRDASRGELAERLEMRHGALRQLLAALYELAARDAAAFEGVLADWRTFCFLERALHPAASRADVEALFDLRDSERGLPGFAGDLPRARGWEVPVIPHGHPLGATGELERSTRGDWLSLADSFGAAYDVIQRLWPETPPWVTSLVPAFVDTGPPPSEDLHTSTSFGPGKPIQFSRVRDPWLHAEDVLHELQHCRLRLMLEQAAFGGWADERCAFASPYRPDPRPMRGLFLGVHAFVAVNELRLRGLRAGRAGANALQSFVITHAMNLFAFRTLCAHFDVRPAGKHLFDEIAQALAAQHIELHDLSSPAAWKEATQTVSEHIQRVQAATDVKLENLSSALRVWDSAPAFAVAAAS